MEERPRLACVLVYNPLETALNYITTPTSIATSSLEKSLKIRRTTLVMVELSFQTSRTKCDISGCAVMHHIIIVDHTLPPINSVTIRSALSQLHSLLFRPCHLHSN